MALHHPQSAARLVVDALLREHLAEPLEDAAVELSIKKRVVQHAARVVHRDIAQHVDVAGSASICTSATCAPPGNAVGVGMLPRASSCEP